MLNEIRNFQTSQYYVEFQSTTLQEDDKRQNIFSLIDLIFQQ